jgi:hypothetical protein
LTAEVRWFALEVVSLEPEITPFKTALST